MGNRYGWLPLPAEIEAREFEELGAQVPDADKALLTTDRPVPAWRDGDRVARVGWYRKDLNAVPSMYVLQPRTIEFPSPPAPLPQAGEGSLSDDDRKRIRREEARDWAPLERRMREAFNAAIAALGWPADDPRRFKYEASATHQEIRAGALEVQDRQDHVFCYFREIDGLPANRTAAVYRDVRDGTVDADAEGRLLALKGELEGMLPRDHVHKYRASWRAGKPQYDHRDLCDDVERDLKAIIDWEVAAFTQRPALEHERDAHREFAEERCRHFVGRQDVLEQIKKFLADPESNRPLVIHGVSGCGKTALMAKAVLDLSQSAVSDAQLAIVSRFIGATPGSSDLRTLLGDLCRELGRPPAEVDPTTPDAAEDLDTLLNLKARPPIQGHHLHGLPHKGEVRMTTPDSTFTILKRAEELLLAGQHAQAAHILEGVVCNHPHEVAGWCNLGVTHYQRFCATADREALATAQGCFEHALQIKPDDADTLSNLGNRYDDLGQLKTAEGFLRRAVAAAPNHADAWSNLGMILHRQDQLDEAAVCYKQAIRANPTHADAWVNLGEALRELRLLDEAVRATQRALDLCPNHPQATKNMQRLRRLIQQR